MQGTFDLRQTTQNQPRPRRPAQLIAYGVLFFAVGITGVVCMMNGSKLAEVKRRCKRMFRGGGENEGAPDLSGPTFSPLPMSTHSLPSELPGNGL